MTTPIGYATLQIIPSLDGVSEQINKQLDGKLRTTGKSGGKALAKGVGEGLKDLEREVESASKAYGKLRDRAADALDKITVEEKKLARARAGGKEDQIAAAEARLNKARRDSARATREAEDGHKSLTSAQKRLGDGADDTGRRMGSLGSSLRNMGGIAGGAALAGIAALTTGVAVAGRELYQLGSDLDEISDTLQIKTGLSGAALDKLRASVEKLGTTNVPASFADISDVAAEVTRNLHLTGQPLEDVTSRLANLARWGQSADVRSLGKVFNGFKIGAEDQAGALNALYEVSTKTGLSIDDLTGALANGGAPLRDLNLGFEDSVALMYAFEAAGLNGEKATTALNKAFGYFATEGIPAAEGLETIIARIRELGDTPEARELSKKVFGGKGGAQFFEAIQNGDLDLQNLQAALQLTGLDINQVSDDTADWSEKWQDLKNELAVATQPLANDIFDTVNAKLGEFSTWVTENEGKVIDFFVGMGEGAISAAEVTLTALAGVVDTLHLFDTLVMKGFSWLPGYDDQAAKEFNDSLGDLSDKLNAAADSSLFNDLRNGLRDVADEAKTAADNTDDLDVGLGRIAGRTIDIKTTVNGKPANLGDITAPALGGPAAPGAPAAGQNPLDVFAPGSTGGSGGVGGIGPGGRPTPGSGLPSLKDLPPLYIGPHTEDTGGAIVPNNANLQQQLLSQFPGASINNDYRQPDGFNEHSSGEAVDVAVNPGGELGVKTEEGLAQGDAINAWMLQNAKPLGIKYTIWRGRNWNPDGTSSPNSGSGITGGHWDHVHARVEGGEATGGQPDTFSYPAPTAGADWEAIAQGESSGRWDLNSGNGFYGGLQFQQSTWDAFKPPGAPARADLATKEQQIAAAEATLAAQGPGAWPNTFVPSTPGSLPGSSTPMALNNAFGPGYEPGIGTPGTNEYGEPGYFEVDPRDVKGVQDRIADQMERIRESDEAARQAQVAIDELEVDADQAERDAAIERKRKADYDAQVARRELGDLELDLAEAEKGTFSPAKESPKSSTRGGASASGFSLPSSLSGFGSAIGEFAGGQIGSFLDVFGVPDSPGWLKGISELVGGIGVSDAAGNSLFDGGNMFGGASPVAAAPRMGGVPPDSTVHGAGAGQPPGPTYIINARDTEDAFIRAQRLEREKAAAKLARF